MPEQSRRAFGTDRLEAGDGGDTWLVCAVPKSWLPRQDKTLTRAEYPGTAVDWDGGVFEVLGAEPLADGGMRYRLAPWEEGHAIRRMERYDEDSEAARGTESDDRRDRVRRRRLSILLAPLAGLLPGAVQKDMESEFGAPALAMTISSALPLFVIGFLGLFRNLLAGLGGGLGLPAFLTPPFPIALYLFGESALRLGSAFAAGEPMGSLPVTIAYEAWREARSPSPATPAAAAPLANTERDAVDRFRMLEPMLSLLSAPEQELLARRFDFEPLRWGKITTAVLLLVAGGNAAVSLMNLAGGGAGIADVLWLLIGGLLTLEQIRRWKRLKAGAPSGSVLGALVRPLVRPLLAAPARPEGL
jgi:hypothetical protein